MKVVISGDELFEGANQFLEVYYKEALNGKLKKLFILYPLVFGLIIFAGIINEDARSDMFLLAGFMIGLVVIIFGTVLITYLLNKRKKINNTNIKKVEYIFDNNQFLVTSYVGENSVDNARYGYERIEKVVETENYFYLFLSKYSALPVKKTDSLDREKFIEFMIDKKVFVKECKKV